jgi:hypothetical protein
VGQHPRISHAQNRNRSNEGGATSKNINGRKTQFPKNRWVNMQEWQLKNYQHLYDKVDQHPRISHAQNRNRSNEGGSTCKNINGGKMQFPKKQVGQHAGTVGQHQQEWWVNMGRNLQQPSCN